MNFIAWPLVLPHYDTKALVQVLTAIIDETLSEVRFDDWQRLQQVKLC